MCCVEREKHTNYIRIRRVHRTGFQSDMAERESGVCCCCLLVLFVMSLLLNPNASNHSHLTTWHHQGLTAPKKKLLSFFHTFFFFFLLYFASLSLEWRMKMCRKREKGDVSLPISLIYCLLGFYIECFVFLSLFFFPCFLSFYLQPYFAFSFYSKALFSIGSSLFCNV